MPASSAPSGLPTRRGSSKRGPVMNSAAAAAMSAGSRAARARRAGGAVPSSYRAITRLDVRAAGLARRRCRRPRHRPALPAWPPRARGVPRDPLSPQPFPGEPERFRRRARRSGGRCGGLPPRPGEAPPPAGNRAVGSLPYRHGIKMNRLCALCYRGRRLAVLPRSRFPRIGPRSVGAASGAAGTGVEDLAVQVDVELDRAEPAGRPPDEPAERGKTPLPRALLPRVADVVVRAVLGLPDPLAGRLRPGGVRGESVPAARRPPGQRGARDPVLAAAAERGGEARSE